MTGPARALAVPGLFARERPVWQPDDINQALGHTRTTGYRDDENLVAAGFLQQVSASRCALGGRNIELDDPLRQRDPVLLAALPVMKSRAADAGQIQGRLAWCAWRARPVAPACAPARR